jgi:hypothetical protein
MIYGMPGINRTDFCRGRMIENKITINLKRKSGLGNYLQAY